MINVIVLYPNEQGKKFDMNYYINSHIPMVSERLKPFGLTRAEIHKGISAPDPNAPPPYLAGVNFYFQTVDGVHEGFKTHGREIMGDIKNYTDIQPTIQISEVIS